MAATLPTHDEMVANIVAAYDAATLGQLQDGADWYPTAQATCRALAYGTDVTFRTVAGVVAALSPRQRWSVNIDAARRIVAAYETGRSCPAVGLRNNVVKAWSIVHEDGHPLDILGGQKVRAFYAAIMGDLSAVVVDVWAARCAGLDTPDGKIAKAQYVLIADAYRAAAKLLGADAATVQAVTWIVTRGSAD